MIIKITFKGTWHGIQAKLKRKYAQLTDEDLLFSDGEEDDLLGRLQQKLGISEDSLRARIADL